MYYIPLLLLAQRSKQKSLMSNLIQFEGRQIRQLEHDGETYYSIVDIVAVLSESPEPRKYWNKIKNRDSQLSPIWRQLKMIAADGKNRQTDCANREGVFRIIQSIPSPNAEPFKRWLAQTAEERLQETEDPSQAVDRVYQSFRDLGYSDEWIGIRLETKKGRLELTDEWKARGVTEQSDYSTLTAILSAGAFGLIPSDHKQIKGLAKENLRDHMTRQELIFTQLAEIQTKDEAIINDAKGLEENKEAARKGGAAAGAARMAFEKETGKKVVSSSNFINQIKAAKAKLLSDNNKKQ